MGTPGMVSEYEQEQRAAICFTAWKNKDKPAAHKLTQVIANISLGDVREEQLNGKPYKVAPVVMIVAGVMNNLLYPAEEISKYTGAWDGRPVTLFHPRDTDGEFVSANENPTIAEQVQLGQLFHSTYDDEKLKSQVWVDIERTKTVRPEILEYLEGKRTKLEVSTGLWGDVLRVSGTHNGESYQGIMTNIRPDHLALLPGGEGACNWEDGCGIRANEGDSMDKKFRERTDLILSNITDRELRSAIQKALDGLDSRTVTNYLEEIDLTKKQVIYEQYTRTIGADSTTISSESKMYRRSYTMDNGEAILADDAKEVQRVVSYKDVTTNIEKGDKEVTDKEKKAKIDALIACQRCRFEEKDREWLTGLNEEQLALVTPPDNVVVKEEKLPDPAPAVNVQVPGTPSPEPSGDKPAMNTIEWLAAQKDMPKEVQETIAEGLMQNQAIKTELITKILAAKGNLFTAEQLQGRSTTELKATAALIGNQEERPIPTPEESLFYGLRNFTANAPVKEDKGPEPLVMPSLEEALKANLKK